MRGLLHRLFRRPSAPVGYDDAQRRQEREILTDPLTRALLPPESLGLRGEP